MQAAAAVGRGRSASNEESDEDVDGVPLDGAALLKGRRETKESDDDSLDGNILNFFFVVDLIKSV